MRCEVCKRELAKGETVYRVVISHSGDWFSVFHGNVGSVCTDCAAQSQSENGSQNRVRTASGQRSSIMSEETCAISSVAASVAKHFSTRGSDNEQSRDFAKSAERILRHGTTELAIVRLGANWKLSDGAPQ